MIPHNKQSTLRRYLLFAALGFAIGNLLAGLGKFAYSRDLPFLPGLVEFLIFATIGGLSLGLTTRKPIRFVPYGVMGSVIAFAITGFTINALSLLSVIISFTIVGLVLGAFCGLPYRSLSKIALMSVFGALGYVLASVLLLVVIYITGGPILLIKAMIGAVIGLSLGFGLFLAERSDIKKRTRMLAASIAIMFIAVVLLALFLTEEPVTFCGVRIIGVISNSPAHLAGFEYGEVIESVDGSKTGNVVEFLDALRKYKPGDNITIRTDRRTVTLTLGEMPKAKGAGLGVYVTNEICVNGKRRGAQEEQPEGSVSVGTPFVLGNWS